VTASPTDEPRPNPATDRARLTGAAYATAAPLEARIALYAYQRDPIDFVAWMLDHVDAWQPFSARSRVLDVGCGPGRYLRALRERQPDLTAIGFDLSAGMAAAAHGPDIAAGIADAMQLPVRDAAFDVVIAAHMLYHVPDIGRAAGELARVVTDTGTVALATNGADHLHAIEATVAEAVVAVTGTGWDTPPRSTARFLIEDAPDLISPALEIVASDRVQREIIVNDPAPIVAYVESEGSLYAPSLPAGARWDDVVIEVGQRVRAVIDRDGTFVAHSDAGVLLCSPAR
jgi:SAM-dependent methyltransferase